MYILFYLVVIDLKREAKVREDIEITYWPLENYEV